MPGLFSGFCCSANHEMCLSPKNHIPTQGFPTSERRRQRKSKRKSTVASAYYQAYQPERTRSQRTRLIHRATHTQQGPGTGRYVSLATPLSSTLRHAQLHFHSEAPFVSFQILAFSLSPHKLVLHIMTK